MSATSHVILPKISSKSFCFHSYCSFKLCATARRAALLYGEILAHGVDAVLAKYRTHEPDEKLQEIATIGQWIEAAGKVFDGKPATFRGYAGTLRLIASEILAIAKNQQRFAQKHAEGYRRKIDAFSLFDLDARSGSSVADRLRLESWRRPRKTTSNSDQLQHDVEIREEPLRSQDLEVHQRVAS